MGDWDDTGESASCLSGAQETVDAYNSTHRRGMRTARARAEAIERGDGVTDSVSRDAPVVDEQKHLLTTTTVTAFTSRLSPSLPPALTLLSNQRRRTASMTLSLSFLRLPARQWRCQLSRAG